MFVRTRATSHYFLLHSRLLHELNNNCEQIVPEKLFLDAGVIVLEAATYTYSETVEILTVSKLET